VTLAAIHILISCFLIKPIPTDRASFPEAQWMDNTIPCIYHFRYLCDKENVMVMGPEIDQRNI
jgi:hypothetical protein